MFGCWGVGDVRLGSSGSFWLGTKKIKPDGKMRTTSFFPDPWRVSDEKCEWIIDTGYPDSQICKNVDTIGGIQIQGAHNNPICESLSENVCGIIGSSFLNTHRVSGDKDKTTIDEAPNDAACIKTHSSSNKQWTEQTSAPFTFEYNGRSVTETCFIDTGGEVSMMSDALANTIGFPQDNFSKAQIRHTDSDGNIVNSPVSFGTNVGVTVTNNNINLTPDRFVVVPDNLNTLYNYKCSVGQHYFRGIDAISVDLPNDRICVGLQKR